MRKLPLIVTTIAVAVLALAGCVKMDQDVKLKADGSSTVKIHYAMREEHVKQMEMMQAMGPTTPGMSAPGTPAAPDMAKMQEMLKKIQEMQKDMPTRPDGTPMMDMDMAKLARQMEALRKGAKPPATGTSSPATPKTLKPEKSVKDQVEDMKKAGRKDLDLDVKKPSSGAMSEEMRKEIEKMKAAARKEAAIGKVEKLKPEVPKVEKPPKLARPAGPLSPGGAGALGGMLFDEKAIRKQFAARKADGVELKDVKVTTKDGWRHAYITATCKDLSRVSDAPAGGGKGGNLGLSKNADGDYVLVMVHPQLSRMPGGTATTAEERKAQLEQARKTMPGFRMSVTLTVPGDVVKTNAHKKSGRTVSWLLDLEDAKFVEKSQAVGREGMHVTFEGDGLKLKTFKPAAAK